MLARNQVDRAILVLYSIRRRSPKSATVALLLGHAYFRKLWRTDGLREYALALSLNRRLKSNAQLIANTVVALDNPTYALARSVIRKWIGKNALPALRRAIRSSHDSRVKARATRLAALLSPPAKRKRR